MPRPYLLWLIWQNIETRQNYHVGNLIHADGEYIFQYEIEKKHRGLQDALKDGYRPHLSFPDLKKVYISKKLFGPFLRRLPNSSRPDFPDLLKKYGLTKDYTQLDLLRATGGRLATDSYHFVHPVYIEGDGFYFDFHVMGWRHYNGESYINEVKSSNLMFEKEPKNSRDPYAIMVKLKGGEILGYVPAFFSEFMTNVMDSKSDYEIKVEKIDQDAIPQLRVSLSVKGEISNADGNFYQKQPSDLIPVQRESLKAT